ncbi:hypothetical protein PRUPE_1G538000 [Prunus persica]|uniref:Cytochrome P450 n=1 Tax=Prunus persica TaxID=3760 RepID=A0A251RHG0_PRUPE|nr:hypothetical protein PRUPE_1G538000 [Prunus persica]
MKSRGERKSPPKAGGARPIIGHLHLLGGSKPPHLVLGKMAERYGPIFTVNIGVHKALIVSSSEIAKELFASRPKFMAAEIMAYNYAFLPFSPYSHYSRQVRKIVLLEVLSNSRLEMLKHVRESEVKASMKGIYERCVTNGKSSTGSNKALVEMREWFLDINENIVFRMIVGKRFGEATSSNSKGSNYYLKKETYMDFLRLSGTFVLSDAIPWLRWLDLGGHERAMKKVAKELDLVFNGWLEEHKQKRKISGQVKGDDDQLDFMDVMLSILDVDGANEITTDYDADTVNKATSMALIVAGVEAPAVQMTWALALLLNNREALKKAQKELDQIIGKGRQVKESDIKNLVYLQAIIKESTHCMVGDYHVPAGTRLLVNLSKLHRDPRVWSDPNEFRPERFLTTHKSFDVKGHDFELIPFGSGRRMCPGMSLALKVIALTLASLLHGFEIGTPTDETVDMGETVGVTNNKATPLEVLFTPRLPAQLYE